MLLMSIKYDILVLLFGFEVEEFLEKPYQEKFFSYVKLSSPKQQCLECESRLGHLMWYSIKEIKYLLKYDQICAL